MANYFVINNKFKPYSFDELIKPYQMYGLAYKEQEALIDEAMEKLFSAANLNQEDDAEAYRMYNTATANLLAAADELASKGLSSNLRTKLRTVAKDYRTTMGALNSAQEALNAERDRRTKLGPDYVYQQENLRIGDFLNGRTPNTKSESLTDITKDVATDFAARANGITRQTWDKLFDAAGEQIKGYYDITSTTGLTQAQLALILADEDTWEELKTEGKISESEEKVLEGFRNSLSSKLKSVGYDDYDPYNQAKIDDAILRGASGGLGSTAYSQQRDLSYITPELNLSWSKFNWEKKKWEDAQAAEETPYVHSDEKNPTAANRTGELKPGWTFDAKGNLIRETDTKKIEEALEKEKKEKEELAAKKGSTTARGFQMDKSVKYDADGKESTIVDTTDTLEGYSLTASDFDSLSDVHKKTLADKLGLSVDDSSDVFLRELEKLGLLVRISWRKEDGDSDDKVARKKKKQTMIVIPLSSKILPNLGGTVPGNDDEFNADGTPKK